MYYIIFLDQVMGMYEDKDLAYEAYFDVVNSRPYLPVYLVSTIANNCNDNPYYMETFMHEYKNATGDNILDNMLNDMNNFEVV